MVDKVNTGISVPEDLLDDFDDVIWELQTEGEIPRDTPRSRIIQQLMQDFVDNHRELLDEEGKRNPTPTVLAD